jgi:hypothetical protein
MTEAASASIVYVDANPIAYAFEGSEELATALKTLFSIFRQKPGLAVTSELTLAEVLPKKKIPDRYFLDLLVWSGMFELRPVTREILVETARYRRFVRPSFPAASWQCRSFLTQYTWSRQFRQVVASFSRQMVASSFPRHLSLFLRIAKASNL